jgi:hypothetical protein
MAKKKPNPRPIITEHVILTGDIIEREMNDAEYALYLSNIAANEQSVKDLNNAAKQKEILIAKLVAATNLTEEELKGLGL